MDNTKRILGIDSGTRVAGYAIVDINGAMTNLIAFGSINAPAKLTFPDRLKKVYKGLSEVILQYSPTDVALEEVFYGKNIKAAIRIGEGRGVAILCAALAGIPVSEYAATIVKKSVTGSGTATKPQVQEMVKNIFKLPEIPKPADAADAIAIAICHCHRVKMNMLTRL